MLYLANISENCVEASKFEFSFRSEKGIKIIPFALLFYTFFSWPGQNNSKNYFLYCSKNSFPLSINIFQLNDEG